MDHYAGIDVSLECSSICVVDGVGKVMREAKVASEPEALIGWFGALGLFLPHYIVGYLGRKRTARFVGLFPEAIDLMVRALRAGLPISEAIINAGQEIGDLGFGQRFDRALLLADVGRRSIGRSGNDGD